MKGELLMSIINIKSKNIDSYNKTILKLIANYLKFNSTEIDDQEWEKISYFLSIDVDSAMKMIDKIKNELFYQDIYRELKINDEIIDVNDNSCNKIFDCMLNYYYIKELLSKLEMKCDRTCFFKNYEIYKAIEHNVCIMNANAGAYECMCNNEFSQKHATQSFESFHPSTYIDCLNLYLNSDEYFNKNSIYLPMLYTIINYQFMTHANAMFLIVITQILKHSEFYTESIHCIAKEFYGNLCSLLKDGRLILIQSNNLFQDIDKVYLKRNKNTDNTTRLHIMYGFDNYDTYSLRLDLCHKGVDWIHYNNNSPGGIKSYSFTQKEYDEIIDKYSNMEKCFLFQQNKWFLKEKSNFNLLEEEKIIFEQIQNNKEHTSVFKKNYLEKDVINFVESIDRFISNLSVGSVDKTGEKAKHCFNLDFLMCRLECLYLNILYGNDEYITKFKTLIIDKAMAYGLIDREEKEIYNTFEGVELIIGLAMERCYSK